jgi:hypothetical protein
MIHKNLYIFRDFIVLEIIENILGGGWAWFFVYKYVAVMQYGSAFVM